MVRPAGSRGIITFPRAWAAAQRLEFMATSRLRRERWAHVGEFDVYGQQRRDDCQAVFVRLTARRARKADQQEVAIRESTG